MNLERFLNQKISVKDVLLYKEPNKAMGKANVFYFCLHSPKDDCYLFLNDNKMFVGPSVRGLLSREDHIGCMWYDYKPTSKFEESPLESDEEQDDFYWQTIKTQKLQDLIDCDEYEGNLPECAWDALQMLKFDGVYTVSQLLTVEKLFVEKQIEFNLQNLGRTKPHQSTLFEF